MVHGDHLSIWSLCELKNVFSFTTGGFLNYFWVYSWLWTWNFTYIQPHKDKKRKYHETPLGGSGEWCILHIFIIKMKTGVKTGVIGFKTSKIRFLKKLHRFLHRFSWFSFFRKIYFFLDLPLSGFAKIPISHLSIFILRPWCAMM